MRGISRLLGALGALLIVAGVLGPIIGFNSGGIFPGIVLLFIGRAMAKQATRTGTGRGPSGSKPPPVPVRSKRPSATRTPPRRTPPVRRKAPERPTAQPAPEPAQRQSMLESILLAGSELTYETAEGDDASAETEDTPRMTSEEMIAGRGRAADMGETEVIPRMTSEEMIAGRGRAADMGETEVIPRMTSEEMIAGRGRAADMGDVEVKQRMSSEEMIADARKRWGQRPDTGRR
jgi:hypothetical protein